MRVAMHHGQLEHAAMTHFASPRRVPTYLARRGNHFHSHRGADVQVEFDRAYAQIHALQRAKLIGAGLGVLNDSGNFLPKGLVVGYGSDRKIAAGAVAGTQAAREIFSTGFTPVLPEPPFDLVDGTWAIPTSGPAPLTIVLTHTLTAGADSFSYTVNGVLQYVDIKISGGPQILGTTGVSVSFAATSGHTIGGVYTVVIREDPTPPSTSSSGFFLGLYVVPDGTTPGNYFYPKPDVVQPVLVATGINVRRGDKCYLSASSKGYTTNVRPAKPNLIDFLGYYDGPAAMGLAPVCLDRSLEQRIAA